MWNHSRWPLSPLIQLGPFPEQAGTRDFCQFFPSRSDSRVPEVLVLKPSPSALVPPCPLSSTPPSRHANTMISIWYRGVSQDPITSPGQKKEQSSLLTNQGKLQLLDLSYQCWWCHVSGLRDGQGATCAALWLEDCKSSDSRQWNVFRCNWRICEMPYHYSSWKCHHWFRDPCLVRGFSNLI